MSEKNVYIQKKSSWITKKNPEDTSTSSKWIQKKEKDTPKECIKRKENTDTSPASKTRLNKSVLLICTLNSLMRSYNVILYISLI